MRGSKKDMSPLKFVKQKILLLCKTETKPKYNASSYYLPPCWVYPLLDKLKDIHYRMNVFVAIGIPYLVKSMQAVHGIHK